MNWGWSGTGLHETVMCTFNYKFVLYLLADSGIHSFLFSSSQNLAGFLLLLHLNKRNHRVFQVAVCVCVIIYFTVTEEMFK
jgi:hypothetical protein